MSSVDERIVNMRFNNGDFEKGIKTTLTSLENLKNGLKLDGAAKGLDDVAASAKKFSLAGMAQGIDDIRSKFSALSIVGITTLTNIANKAVEAGSQLVKSLTVEPIMAGLHEYETNLNSIQTILANTGLEGQKGLDKVNKALGDLNTYSDQTIYNFSEMARNIGTFTAAGVKLDVATGAIKGIANLAAVSGSNAEQASTAMYQLSQALATGRVALIDWNSVVNAGMGGKVFQESLKETARAHGVAVDDIIKKEGSFRDSLQKGWLTSSILTETLSKFTGDLTAKQLKTMGYNEQQIAGILKLGKTAKDAATKVKTMSQLIGTLQEAAGSGWAKTWQLIFGDFDQAKVLFTGVNNALGGFITASADARNKVLTDWSKLGGRTVLIQAIADAFHNVIAIVTPVKDAFRQIFPATTGKQLYALTVAIGEFAKGLKIGADTADKVQRTFAGFFAVLHIGKTILVEGVKLLLRLFGVVGEGKSKFLDTTAGIGDFLVKLDNAISKGGIAAKVFQKIGDVLEPIIRVFKNVGSAILDAFNGIDFGGIGKGLSSVATKFASLTGFGDVVVAAWRAVFGVLDDVWNKFKSFASKVAGGSSQLGEAVANGLSNVNVGDVLAAINTGMFAALVLGLRGFMGKVIGALKGENQGASLIDSIKDSFGQLTSTLKSMQTTLKATTLLEIAIAVGILALSVSKLSQIDSAGLTKALTAMGVMFGQLMGSMLIFENFSKGGGLAKMPIAAAGMILLAIAIDILASAVKKLGDMKWDELARGLTGVTVLLGALALVTKPLSANAKGMISAGLGIIVLATGIKILGSVVKDLADLNWEELSKGLVGVSTILLALGLYSQFAGANGAGIANGVGIILLATGIKIMASAVKDLGTMNWENMAKGLVALAGSMAIISLALIAVPPTAIASAASFLIVATSLGLIGTALEKFGSMGWENIGKAMTVLAGSLLLITAAMIGMTEALPGAAALIVVAYALQLLAPVLQTFGNMDWENIAKAMVVLAGSLLLITAAMIGMTAALPGAAALLIVSFALQTLAPVLIAFGNMSWESIAKGLLMLAGAFAVIGVAGLLLTPVIPTLIGFGLAVTLIGVGLLSAGVGVMAFAAGLTALAAAGAVGTAAIVAFVSAILGLIPMAMRQIGLGIIAFAEVISKGGPAITKAIVTVLTSLLTAIDTLAPKIISTLSKLVMLLLQTLVDMVPKMTEAGMKIILGFLNGVANNIQKIVEAGLRIVTNFMNGVSSGLPALADSAAKMIISFVNSVADAIRNNSEAMGKAGGNLATALIEGMVKGILGGVSQVGEAAKGLAKSAYEAAKNFLDINSPSKKFIALGKSVNEGFAKGLRTGDRDKVDAAINDLRSKLSDAMRQSSQDVADAEKKLTKLTKARKKDTVAIRDAKSELAQARTELKLTSNAHNVLDKYLRDETTHLDKLSEFYAKNAEDLKTAQSALEDMIKTRADFASGVAGDFNKAPEIAADTTVETYIKNITKQISDVQEFSSVLQRLRQLGLNDNLYKEFLAKGVDALPFLKGILEGNVAGGTVSSLNSLNDQLTAAAASLGSTASSQLYDAGVNAAQGLVNGLKMNEKVIQDEMNRIADQMVAAIKKQLQIKSPSRVFAEVGKFSVLGLAEGFKSSSALVKDSAANVGKEAILAMSKSIAGMTDLVNGDMNLNPVITPVLDLTNVKRDAGQLDGLLNNAKMGASVSYGQAASISASSVASQVGSTQAAIAGSSPAVSLVQNNYSPVALSAVDIYRQTKNQLSLVKEALNA